MLACEAISTHFLRFVQGAYMTYYASGTRSGGVLKLPIDSHRFFTLNDSKSVCEQSHEGSNPSLSASKTASFGVPFFAYILLYSIIYGIIII